MQTFYTTGTFQALSRSSDMTGAHILYMFNEQDKYVENAFSYISEGLDNGDNIIIAEDKTFYRTIVKQLERIGYSHHAIQSIVYLSNEEFYLNKDRFSAEKGLTQLQEVIHDQLLSKRRTRTWGNVPSDVSSLSEIRRYESETDKFIKGKNLISVCCYNALTTPAFFQNDLMKVHDYLMFDDQLEKSPFYNQKSASFPTSERKRLDKLEKENQLLKEKNDKLLIDSARQKELEKYLKLDKLNAEKANHAKNLFLSQMSHDLRTPLNTIQGFAQIILMNEKESDLRNKVNKIFYASEQLLKLIEEVLDFSLIDSGKITINKEKIQVKHHLEKTVNTVLELNNTDIEVKLTNVNKDLYIEVDPLRFSQIITNLLNNAIKYNKPNGKVTIFCEHDKQQKQVKITIEDTGLGIDQQELNLIFEPFYRCKSNANNWKGTGLGLAIVSQLTERMNGTYGATTEKDKGSTFWVSFQTTNRLNHRVENETEVKSRLNLAYPTNVLYIEDNSENIDVIKSMFNLIKNTNVSCISTGEEGLIKAFEHPPDVILLDLTLPDIDGIELLKKLKSNPITNKIPVIVISADAMKSTIKQALEAGCSAYITKPIDFIEFRIVFEKTIRYLGYHQSERKY
ncbi:ATP-binding protein [Aquibacillus salsiterrae]|uniref:histidine kinase n=1 Tax=Aquibacillus salsiterrae TaxID=2950439 RepID=A0A9X3WFQ1_9BACI|nr:ATP-binding protein [Aquibacillus salsiterrae]MDC3417591.1 ATP-binding protein [Aquibacillus salsiterrae]